MKIISVALVLGCPLLAGCQQGSSPAPPTTAQAAPEGTIGDGPTLDSQHAHVDSEAPQAPESSESEADQNDTQAGGDEPSTEAQATTAEAEPPLPGTDEPADTIVAAQEPVEAEGAQEPSERFLLLTPGGPLVVDVAITIGGEAYGSALDDLVDKALEAADTDGDGEPTWEEVANSPRFMYGQFGNLEIDSNSDRTQMMQIYDRNGDGIVNRDELPRFVTRNVGGARSFSLRSSNEYRTSNRPRSPVRLLLDEDRNGAITSEERDAAPARMLNHDADDNQIVSLADFKAGIDQNMAGQMSNQRRTTEPDTAVMISERTNWRAALYSLQELYAYGDPIQASDWPQTPDLFTALDADEDGILQRDEAEKLAVVEPHVRLKANFGFVDDAGQTVSNLELVSVSETIEPLVNSVRTHDRRISIEMDTVEVEFFINEDPALNNYEQVAKSQFMALDTDSNGYLDEDEVPANLPGYNIPFEGLDADSNGEVHQDELATFLNLRLAAFRGQVRARAADQEDAMFTALDSDGNGQLNSREVRRTPHQLDAMDRNKDGQLQAHEIPGSMVVGFVRGNPQQDDTLFVMPVLQTPENERESLPRWYRGMDANGDGEIGSREFLGPVEKFQELDSNGDGFLNPEEVASLISQEKAVDSGPTDQD